MNTRTYARTTRDAFKGLDYSCAVEVYRPSFLASRAFWIGGALSLAVWFLLGLVVM